MHNETNPLKHAESLLLEPYRLGRAGIERAFGNLMAHRLDYADLYFQYLRAEGWSLEEGIVKSGSFSIEQGVGVRAVSGEKTAFAYSDEISIPALEAATYATRSIALSGASSIVPVRAAARVMPLYPADDPLNSLPDTEKVRLLERIEKMARDLDPRVVEVMASLSGSWEVVLIARSDGHLAADVRPLTRVSISVIMEEGGRREQGSAGGGGRHDYGVFNDALLQDYAQRAVHQASINLAARPAPAGTMTVVLGNGWPGILLHEAIGHGLEGDFNRKGSSAFAGRIGERVAAKGVTVVDDGTLPGRRGSLTIDDEGNPTQRTVLIEDGILVGYMQDMTNARLMGAQPTGNGRRESFSHLPLPRMTNTLMQNGAHDPQEIIASVERGLYAVNFGGGQVDITSGKFVFSAAEAYMIEGGKITYPVKGATLIGNGPDALTRISMIGNDMALDPGVGMCGKEGQSVPVGVGQPTLRLDGLTVGGTA
ncbi:MAG: metalloprotease TldD [Betaproteobacteria bacterium]|nr:metalloprotease TldD [Betaproteobacteria bacterium]